MNDMAVKLASSTAIVVGNVEPSAGGMRVSVVEVLAGNAPASFTVNTNVRRDYETCELVAEEQSLPPVPGRFLLYLRPDEFGTADYRLAFWGSARNEVNDKHVTDGLPTLRDIREAVGQPRVTSAAPEATSSRPTWPYSAFVAGVAGLALGAALWRRSASTCS